jgi:hypothetical protein
MRFVPAFALCLSLPLVAAAQDKKSTVVVLGKLKATTPAEWKSEKPANLLRKYQFRLPEVKDLPGSEIIFMDEANPNVEKNFPRWKNTMIPPEGKTIDDICKTSKWDVKGATVTVLDMVGTWKYKERPQDPASKEMLLDNYRVVWVIVEIKDDETWHIRMSGPVTSVDAQFKGLEELVKGLK